MFRTLDDLKKNDKQKKDEEKKKKVPDTYAGGEKSGLAIEQPDDFEELIKQAKKESTPDMPDSKKSAKITLWNNGFQINDGEFRDKKVPINQKFIAELKEGQVPLELRGKYPQGLSVTLENKTEEEYVPPPPPKYVEFSGSGISLGQQQQQQQQQQQHGTKPQPTAIPLNRNQPTTNVQVRLHSGSTLNLEINLTTTVGVLFDHVRGVVGQYNIKLISGFPPKPLTNMQQTIEEADLMDSLINQSV